VNIKIERANNDQSTAVYSILAIAGEHMHRVLNLSHWYPFPGTEHFIPRLEDRDIYVVYADEFLVGTFNISTKPEPYYLDDMSAYWMEPSAVATYFSGFAILPSHQQMGIGTQCMTFVDQFVKEQTSHRYIRFDGVANHPKLLHFYARLGYEERGELPVKNTAVMCFEKYLYNDN
jgi:GNAT superfamily N-acetyltransferase